MAKNVSDLNNSLDNKFASKSHTHTGVVTSIDYTDGASINIDGADYSTQIGTLNSLQTSNKNNLVAAINEVFQSGSNAKQKLVDALTSNNINCSTSDSWDTLIGHISSLGGGSLDIISAASLPATGKENQICVVTSNPTDKFLFTSSDSDISSVTDNTIIIHSSVEVTTSNYITQSGNFKSTFEISKCIQSGVIVPSYIYTNGAWQEFTPNRIIWIENGKFLIDNELMNNTSMPNNSYVKYNSTIKGMGFTTGSTTYESLAYATSRVKVDLSSYKRAYIQYYKNLESGEGHWMAAEPTLFVNATMNIGRKESTLTTKNMATMTSDTYIKDAGNITNFSGYALYEATYDLSNLTGTKYLGIGLNMSGSTAIYITTLYFY
jgi:hypothetical protein